MLTRLPLPLRVPGPVAIDLLSRTFKSVMPLDEESQRSALGTLAAAGISGGAVYDGIVALTVRQAGARLCTRDRRARATYESLGIDIEWIG